MAKCYNSFRNNGKEESYMIILDILCSLIGVALILITITFVVLGGAEFLPMMTGLPMPALMCIIGLERMATYFGVSFDSLWGIMMMFVAAWMISMTDTTIGTIVGATGSATGLVTIGLLMIRILPRAWCLFLAEHIMTVISACFLPLFVLMVIIVIIVG